LVQYPQAEEIRYPLRRVINATYLFSSVFDLKPTSATKKSQIPGSKSQSIPKLQSPMTKSSAPIDASTLTRNGSCFRLLDLDFRSLLGLWSLGFGISTFRPIGSAPQLIVPRLRDWRFGCINSRRGELLLNLRRRR
jgi:hypothetical protein